jgi:ribose/xylose/arabinose/galactoside ABC-type transport system permease subunit
MIDPVVVQSMEAVRPWFENPPMVGAVLGGFCGLLGGLYGTLAGVLVPRGKGRAVIFGLHWAVLAVGIVLIMGGVTALAMQQPYGVWFAMLLPGVIMTCLMTVFTPLLVRMWYRQAERRRLEADGSEPA